MKILLLHHDLPRTNWYASHLQNYTYGKLSKQGIDFNLIFNGEHIPNDNKIDLIDISEFCNKWHQDIVTNPNYSNIPIVCTTAEVSLVSLLNYLKINDINTNVVLGRIKHFIARSSHTKRMLIQFGISENKIDVIHYGTDLDKFNIANDYKEREKAFLYIGSINRNKGIHHLVDSYIKIINDTDWKLKIYIGEWNNDERLLEKLMAIALKYNSKIVLIPFPTIGNLPNVYNDATCFCHFQDFECPAQCSNPSIWALACGLPLISLNTGVFKDYIIDGKNGFLCDNIQELPEKMLSITKLTEQCWTEMSNISRNIAEKDHSPENVAVKYKLIYNKIIH